MPRTGLADLHIHTCFSDGWPTPTDVVEHVIERTDLDVIAVTDHDTIEGALRAADYAESRRGVHVIVGEEISSRDGHVVGLFLDKHVRPGLTAEATVDAIHEQGGIAFAPHPFWRRDPRGRRRRTIHGVGWLAAELDFDAVEVENSSPGLGLSNLVAQRLNLWLDRAELGNSDAHILDALGRGYTTFPGSTPKALRTAIVNGRTQARRRSYGAVALMRYAVWSFNHPRLLAPASGR